MEWPKLKNIVLLVLLLTNAFLLFFVADRAGKDRALEQRTRQEAVDFLEENGIRVPQEQLPQEIDLQPQTAQRDRTEETRLAQALLGEGAVCQSLGGEVYRYLSALGTLQFHRDGTFSGEFAAGAFPLGDQESSRHAQDILALLGFAGTVTDAWEEGDEQLVTVRQSWADTPLFNLQVTCVYREGELRELRGGRRLLGQPQAQPQTLITVPTALVCFYNGLSALGDVCREIHAITPGYAATGSLTGAMTLTPVWRITTDTGVYQLELIAGALTRVP